MKLEMPYLKNLNFIKEPKTKDEKKLKELSEQFEAIFLKMMFDSMEKTLDRKSSPFYGGQGEEIFRNMLNEEQAKKFSKNTSFGMAEMLYRQLSKGLNIKGNDEEK